MSDFLKKQAWNESYQNRDNVLMWPNEEVIRWVSRYIVKRHDWTTNHYRPGYSPNSTFLDFGCGSGRHVKMLNEFGLVGYGVDISDVAVDMAKRFLEFHGQGENGNRILLANDEGSLPFEQRYFDGFISHAVFDSMPFAVAKKNIITLRKVVKAGSINYLDLITAKGTEFGDDFIGEVEVNHQHEKGTVQSYFDSKKAAELVNGSFEINEIVEVVRHDLLSNFINSRLHITLAAI